MMDMEKKLEEQQARIKELEDNMSTKISNTDFQNTSGCVKYDTNIENTMIGELLREERKLTGSIGICFKSLGCRVVLNELAKEWDNLSEHQKERISKFIVKGN